MNIRATPLLTLFDIEAEVAGSTCFTTLDLKEAFFQMPVRQEDRQCTAFGCAGTQLYQYQVIPMGCTISPAILQSCLMHLLAEHYFRGVIVYVDDMLLYTKQNETHHRSFVRQIVGILCLTYRCWAYGK